MAKVKWEKVDGLGPLDIKKIRWACRTVWYRSHVRGLVIKRCTGKDGFLYCELKECRKRTPKLKIDHKIAVGDVDEGFLKRLYCPSSGLQGLCNECHNKKTKAERAALRLLRNGEGKPKPRAKKPRKIKDFF